MGGGEGGVILDTELEADSTDGPGPGQCCVRDTLTLPGLRGGVI